MLSEANHTAMLTNDGSLQGLKKVPSSRPGQVDSPAWQVTFLSHLSDGQGLMQVVCQLSQNSVQGKHLRAACSMCKLESSLFSSLALVVSCI